jgi:hypothetical protein
VAQNPASSYGADIACMDDADGLFSGVVGLPALLQDLYHRVTTPAVLGPDGDDWGEDARRLLGMPTTRAVQLGPRFAAAVQKDPRVLTADVRIAQAAANTPYSFTLTIVGTSAAGPFALVLGVGALSIDVLTGQAP